MPNLRLLGEGPCGSAHCGTVFGGAGIKLLDIKLFDDDDSSVAPSLAVLAAENQDLTTENLHTPEDLQWWESFKQEVKPPTDGSRYARGGWLGAGVKVDPEEGTNTPKTLQKHQKRPSFGAKPKSLNAL